MSMDTAIILAGGKSTRMGFDKQFLVIDDQRVIDRITEKLKGIFKEIIIVTNKPDEYKHSPYIIVQDEIEGFGPLGGIHIGLKSSNSLYNYIIACDMPFINTAYIEYMKKRIHISSQKTDAVVTLLGQWIEPFNGFYSKKLVDKIEKALEENKRRIITIFEESKVIYIKESKARIFSPGWEMFMNLNSPEDFKNYLALKDRGGSNGCYKKYYNP